jgi:hypothetical protein
VVHLAKAIFAKEGLNPSGSQIARDAPGSEGQVLIRVGQACPTTIHEPDYSVFIEQDVREAKIPMRQHGSFLEDGVILELLPDLGG